MVAMAMISLHTRLLQKNGMMLTIKNRGNNQEEPLLCGTGRMSLKKEEARAKEIGIGAEIADRFIC
jgi:hypothetical protein